MSSRDNKAIARRFAQVWAAGGMPIVDELAAPDIVVSYPVYPEPLRGPEQFKAALGEFVAAFPDLSVEVDYLVSEGDTVAARWTLRGTHQGELFGIAATGKAVCMSGMSFLRIAGGKVVEERGIGNTLGLLQQLGAMPELAPW